MTDRCLRLATAGTALGVAEHVLCIAVETAELPL